MFNRLVLKDLTTNKTSHGHLKTRHLEIGRHSIPLNEVTIVHVDTEETFKLFSGAAVGLVLPGKVGFLAAARKRRVALFVVKVGDRAWMTEVPKREGLQLFNRMLALSARGEMVQSHPVQSRDDGRSVLTWTAIVLLALMFWPFVAMFYGIKWWNGRNLGDSVMTSSAAQSSDAPGSVAYVAPVEPHLVETGLTY